jgi:hypothetical protein
MKTKIATLKKILILSLLLSNPAFSQFQSFGLEGKVINDIKHYAGILYAATDSGVYKKNLFVDTTWIFTGLENIKVTAIYPHDIGPVSSGIVMTAGISPTFTEDDSALIYCRLDVEDDSWAITDTGINRSEVLEINSVDGFPSPLICGETYAGGNGKLYRRGLSSWYEKVFDIGIGQLNVVKTNSNTGDVWIGGENGIFAPYISKSTDLGDSWNTAYLDLGGDNACNSIEFDINDTAVIYAGMEGLVIKTTNGGESWEQTGLTNTPYYFYGLAYDPFNNILYAGGSTNNNEFGLFWSYDKGETWHTFLATGIFLLKGISSLAIAATLIPEDYILYIGTYGDGVLSFRAPVNDIDDKRETISEFQLKQNYPNPFNAQTTIEFTTPPYQGGDKGVVVTLKIYDVLGNEVATLVSDYLSPGTHRVTWNADNIASGVYLYHLQAGSFTAAKRLVLLK